MKFSEFLLDPVSSRDHLLLIGNPVSHSVSPIMHNLAIHHHALDLQYVAVEVLYQELPSLIAHFNSVHFKGGNITLPYKETLLSAVDRHSDLAEDMQVINCIQKIDHEIIGHNTDSYGFVQPLRDLGLIKLDSALIFGYGGGFEVCNIKDDQELFDIKNFKLHLNETYFEDHTKYHLLFLCSILYPKHESLNSLVDQICNPGLYQD